MVYVLFALDILLTVGAQLALRVGAVRLGKEGFSFSFLLEPAKNSLLLLGLFFYGVSFFLYIFILSRLQVHIVYPIAVGTTLVLITLASYFFLKEAITTLQIVGTSAIVIGIFLLLLPK